MTEIEQEKRALRREMRRRSAALPDSYWKEAGERIAGRALRLPEYLAADVVLGFASVSGEPLVYDFLRGALSAGKRLALPVCAGEGVIEAREIRSLRDLRPGKYGIPEPAARCPAVAPEELEFALIPCVCCTAEGLRLGHGGGYYDRYLTRYRGVAAAVCPEAMLCTGIPVGEFDLSIPLVITENAVYSNGTARPPEGGKGMNEHVC